MTIFRKDNTMNKNILLSLAFLLVLALPCLKSEVEQPADEITLEEAIAQSAADFSVFEGLDDVNLDIIRQVETTEPKFKETWKIKWLGFQALMEGYKLEAEEYISKHKLACGTVTAGTVATIALITYLIVKKK